MGVVAYQVTNASSPNRALKHCSTTRLRMTSGAEREYGRRRYLYTGWAVLETMLFGGIVNGWASLVFVLKEDGLYGDLCPPAASPPADNTTALMPTGSERTCPCMCVCVVCVCGVYV